MAHISERVFAFVARINVGVAAAYASSIGAVIAELPEVGPTMFGSVPRIYEKAFDKIRGDVARAPAVLRGVFHWALGIGRRRARYQITGQDLACSLGPRGEARPSPGLPQDPRGIRRSGTNDGLRCGADRPRGTRILLGWRRRWGDVVARPEFQSLFVEPIRRGNRNLARVERVRRFTALGRDFSQEEGELTPTMKMKRRTIEKKFATLFDRLYDDPDFGLDVEPPGSRS